MGGYDDPAVPANRPARTWGRRVFLKYAVLLTVSTAGVGLLSACSQPTPAPAKPAETKPAETKPAPQPTAAPAKPAEAAPAAKAAPGQAPADAAKPTAAPAQAAGKPAGDQVLTVGLSLDPGGTLHPQIVWNVPNITTVIHHLYEPLARFNDKLELVPVLAESWQWTGPTTMRFKLRDGVTFTNGEAFDAESVKYSFDLLMDKDSKSPIKPLFPKDVTVTVVDRLTADLVLQEPYRPLGGLIQWVMMLPPKAGPQTNFANTAIGTGMFKLLEYRPNEVLTMEQNPGYWGAKPKLTKMTVRYIPENGTRIASLERGEVQMINNLPPDQIKRIKDNPNLEVVASDTLRTVNLAMQNDRPPFNDLRVRQAAAHAIDRDAIVEGILQGYGSVAKGPLSPSATFYKGDLPALGYDPDRAKRLLAEAGFAGGGPEVKFGSPNGRVLMDRQTTEACGSYLEAVGFKVELDIVDFGVYLPKSNAGGYDIYFFSRGGGVTGGDPAVLNDFYSPTTASTFKYKNPRVDELLKKGQEASTLGESELRAIYEEAQVLIWNDAPWVFLHYLPGLNATSKRLKGWTARPDEKFFFFNAYLE